MRIALDAMGGDNAPRATVEGAIAALNAHSDFNVALVGDAKRIEDELARNGYSDSRLTIEPAEGVVGMGEKPTEALRRKPDCSIAVCWRLMAERRVDAVVSAGNTGAVVAAGLRTRLFLKGVKRPGIAVGLPTCKGRSVLVDVGANPAARPEHLYQYAVMGFVYARDILGVPAPKIGLMNIGSEEGKGNELYRETHRLLSQSSLRSSYIGNVEGRGLYQGDADVLVCEGFVGNVVLKVSEGMARFLLRTIAQDVLPNAAAEADAATTAFNNVTKRFEYHEHGGAPLLGIDGICIIGHGSSKARSIENALNVAATFKDRHINAHITQGLTGQHEA